MKLSPNEIAYVAKAVGFADADLVTMVAVCLAESGGDTEVMGRSTTGSIGNRDHGLAQISNRWHGDKLQATPNWRDPYVNLRIAFKIYSDAGKTFDPWHVFTSDAYKVYLPDADIAVKYPFPPPNIMSTLGEALKD